MKTMVLFYLDSCYSESVYIFLLDVLFVKQLFQMCFGKVKLLFQGERNNVLNFSQRLYARHQGHVS